MAERMVFDDLRKSMGKSLIWAHEPKLFVAGVRNWEAGLRRQVEGGKSKPN